MRKLVFVVNLLLLVTLVQAQPKKSSKLYSVAFYNLENLFDTIHDVGKNDQEYLPQSAKKWDTEKYLSKLTNMSKVMSELSRDKVEQGPAVIGVAEIENRRVLDDLVAQPMLAPSEYEIVHYEGPDKRGIDCALLYDPKQYKVSSSKLVLSEPFEGDTIHKTRGFLIVNGKLAGDKVCFIVNHWPSRGAAEPVRIHAAQQVRALVDSLERTDKKLKIIVMGDMNDDPMDKSMLALGAKKYPNEVGQGDMYSPFWEVLEDKGVGTLLYRGKWNLFDQILVSPNLISGKKGLKYNDNEVFMREYLFEQEGKYKGSPLRTHAGNKWLNGYSDHLPTIIYLSK